MSWTLNDLTQALSLEDIKNKNTMTFNRLWSDTRDLQSGDCYLAIKGKNFNGHEFIAEAIAKGAVALLVSEDVGSCNIPVIKVADTRIALGQFALWHRQQMPLKKLLGITGSNGKTTVKMMAYSVISNIAPTLATQGNLNNDLGVPKSLLNIKPTDEYAIIEMGASGLEEIRYLTQLAQPDVALITNASAAHLEGFGSLQGIIKTKGEIYEGLMPNGVAILNRDSVGYKDWLKICNGLQKSILTFGEHPDSDVQIDDIETTQKGVQFNLALNPSLKQKEPSYLIKMSVLGRHNAMNAASVVASCLAAGFSMELILPGLVKFTGVEGRLNTLSYKKGVLIDDAYNANPASVKAGIDTLASLSGQAIFCFGGMAELGEEATPAHQGIALHAKQQGIKKLYLLGDLTKSMATTFGEGAVWYEDYEVLTKEVITNLQQNSEQVFNILVKGSRSAKMDRVVQKLLEAV